MKYDLGDCTLWEYMFPSNDKPQLVLPDEDNLDDDEENVGCDVIRLFSPTCACPNKKICFNLTRFSSETLLVN